MSEIFQPRMGTSAAISATTSSSRVAVSNVPSEGGQVRVAVGGVSGAAWIFVAFGDSTVTATSADVPMLPNTVEVFTVGRGVTHVAALTDAGTATVEVMAGLGE